MVFSPVSRAASLVESVVDQIHQRILDGRLRSGDRLPRESEFVEQLGVSRTVLREALGRLKATGLVTIERGRGMFVADPGGVVSCAKFVRNTMTISPQDLEKFTEFRLILECHAARRGAETAAPEDLAELEALCERMNRPGLDRLESARTDFAFHLRLVDLAGNELLHNTMEVIQEFIVAAMLKTTPEPRDTGPSRILHMKIVDAIRSGNPDRAEREVRGHIGRLKAGLGHDA